MSFRFKRSEKLGEAVERVTQEQLKTALQDLADSRLSDSEKIHRLRKCCKKMRSLLRLLAPHMKRWAIEEESIYREMARNLAGLRDTQTTLDALNFLLADLGVDHDGVALRSLRDNLIDFLADESVVEKALIHSRDLLLAGLQQVDKWPVSRGDKAKLPLLDLLPAYLASYRRARDSWLIAKENPEPEQLHRWRKQLQCHYHQSLLMKNITSVDRKDRLKKLTKLAEFLGLEHDLENLQVVLEKFETGGVERIPAPVMQALHDKKASLINAALTAGEKLFGPSGKQFAKSL